MSENLIKYINAYDNQFDSFPTFQLVPGRSENQVIAIIKECLTKGKDVYELGYLVLDPNIIY